MSLITSTSDMIDALPTDNTQLTFKEKGLLDAIYPDHPVNVENSQPPVENFAQTKQEQKTEEVKEKEKGEKAEKIDNPTKEIKTPNKSESKLKAWEPMIYLIISSIVVCIIQLPIVDEYISKIVQNDKIYHKIAIKTLTFAIIFFIMSRLVKKFV